MTHILKAMVTAPLRELLVLDEVRNGEYVRLEYKIVNWRDSQWSPKRDAGWYHGDTRVHPVGWILEIGELPLPQIYF